MICAATFAFQMSAFGADTDALIVTETGNVGIGLDDPQYRLDVKGNIHVGGLLLGTYPRHSDYMVFGSSSFDQTQIGNYALLQHNTTGRTFLNSPSDIRFRIKNVDKMVLSDGGNIGVGTPDPITKLEIKSGGNADIRLTNTNDGSYWELNTRNSGRFDIVREGLGNVVSLKKNGMVGIGTTSPSAKLHVHGYVYVKDHIDCYRLITRYNPGADFVFEEDYDLPDLSEVKAFIEKNKHLPEIPSAAEMQANGVSVSDMLTKHLQKIEELTLYMIDLKSDNTKLQSENGDLRALVHHLEERLSRLETQTLDMDEMDN
jgi:hypothetical protein